MAAFPILQSGAVAQYPLRHSIIYPVFRHRFLDQRQQCFSVARSPRRQWQVQLSLLSERELGEIVSFLEAVRGRQISFSFTDPHDGTVHTNCVLDGDEWGIEEIDLVNGRTTLIVTTHEA